MQLSQLAKAFEEFKSANDERIKQIETNGVPDPVTEQKLFNINKELDEYKNLVMNVATASNRPNLEIGEQGACQSKSSLASYARTGIDIEKKFLSVSSEPDGGFLVDKATSKHIIKKIEANSVMRKLASIEEISTHALDIIGDEGSFEAGWVSEMDARPETKASQITKSKIEVHEIYAQPKATQKLLDDARIDIAKWLADKISDRFAAVESNAFIKGDGINKPKGILSYDSVQTSIMENPITADDIMILYYSLDAKYASKGSFLMHRNMLQTIRSLKRPSTGQYLWAPGLSSDTPDTLLGAPVFECSDMPHSSSDACVAFADFKEAYKIVDRSNITIIRDPFTEKPFVKFYATKRVGGAVVNNKAITILKYAKS